jgi:hypothetical protein
MKEKIRVFGSRQNEKESEMERERERESEGHEACTCRVSSQRGGYACGPSKIN